MASGGGWGSGKAPWLLLDAIPCHAQHQQSPAPLGGTDLAVLATAVMAPIPESLLQPAWTAVCALPRETGWHSHNPEFLGAASTLGCFLQGLLSTPGTSEPGDQR